MEQQSALSTDPIKITCPHCGSHECFEESQAMEDGETVNSYMCMGCGYTSSTLNKIGSKVIESYEETTAELIKELRWIDENGLVWYPTVLNFPSFGIIFPDGTSKEDWKWTTAPAVDIPVEEQKNYPIPGVKDQFYTRRVDLKAGKTFPSTDFYAACKDLGFIQS